MKITLCVLTLNEIDCLQAIFDSIPTPNIESGYDEIIAIDGGSTDGTVDFFQDRNIKVIGQSKRGRGEAFQLAFEKIQADALFSFHPMEMKRFLI